MKPTTMVGDTKVLSRVIRTLALRPSWSLAYEKGWYKPTPTELQEYALYKAAAAE